MSPETLSSQSRVQSLALHPVEITITLHIIYIFHGLLFFATLATSSTNQASHATLLTCNSLLTSYDYIVFGAGTAGLTVADRLSETPHNTVLCIEYGYLDHSYTIRNVQFQCNTDFPPDPIAVPGIYFNLTRFYNTTSIPLKGLNNRTMNVANGAVGGGSSAVNGMFFDRGSAEDYDSWVAAAGEEYEEEWGWDSLLSYFRKSVSFHPPTEEMVRKYNMTSNVSAAYGGNTPVHSSYHPFQWAGLFMFQEAHATIPGVEFPDEGVDGSAVGTFWVTYSIDPSIRRRSFSLTGHWRMRAVRRGRRISTCLLLIA